MSGPIRALLFDYGETLVRNWPSAGMSRPEPGVHATLRRLATDYDLAVAAFDETPAAAIREDLARVGLADLFETVCSAADTRPPSRISAVERALADLGVSPAEAVLVTGREPGFVLPGLTWLYYRPSRSWIPRPSRRRAVNAAAELAGLDDLPRALAHRAAGEPEQWSWQSAARLGGLLLGFALGTAAGLYLWQRQETDLSEGESEPSD